MRTADFLFRAGVCFVVVALCWLMTSVFKICQTRIQFEKKFAVDDITPHAAEYTPISYNVTHERNVYFGPIRGYLASFHNATDAPNLAGDVIQTFIHLPYDKRLIEDINTCACPTSAEGCGVNVDYLQPSQIKTFLCPRKALINPDNLNHWCEFCQCVQSCMGDKTNQENLAQEESELNCSDYCSSYADGVEQ